MSVKNYWYPNIFGILFFTKCIKLNKIIKYFIKVTYNIRSTKFKGAENVYMIYELPSYISDVLKLLFFFMTSNFIIYNIYIRYQHNLSFFHFRFNIMTMGNSFSGFSKKYCLKIIIIKKKLHGVVKIISY